MSGVSGITLCNYRILNITRLCAVNDNKVIPVDYLLVQPIIDNWSFGQKMNESNEEKKTTIGESIIN